MTKTRATFVELQRQNRRRAFLLGFVLFLVLGGAGAALGSAWGSWPLGALAGVAIALVQFLVARSAGDRILLAVAKAEPVRRLDRPQLVNVVEEVAIAAGVPCPEIRLIEDESPNAFAVGFRPDRAAVAVTTGLLEKLKRDELQAVVAHEIGHIRNGDSGYMVLMAVMVGTIVILADLAWHTLRWGGRSRSRSSKGGGPALILVALLLLALLAPLISRILQAAVSREREYLADATSVELTRNPSALASALRALTKDPARLKFANRGVQHLFIVNPLRKRRGGGGALASHPPLEKRIRRIEGLLA